MIIVCLKRNIAVSTCSDDSSTAQKENFYGFYRKTENRFFSHLQCVNERGKNSRQRAPPYDNFFNLFQTSFRTSSDWFYATILQLWNENNNNIQLRIWRNFRITCLRARSWTTASTNRSINQSIDHSISQSIDHSISQSIDRSIN